jgi:hypothetical protein
MSYFFLADFLSPVTPTAAGFATDAPAANVAEPRPQVYGAADTSASGARFEIATGINDVVAFDEGGGTLTAVLAPGAYSVTTLITEMQTQMDAVGALTYTVSRSSTTGVWAIGATGSFSLEWGDPTSGVAGLAATLGWDASSTGSAAGHLADDARWSGALSLVYDLGSAIKVRPCALVMSMWSDSATADYAGFTVYGSNTNWGSQIQDWINGGAEGIGPGSDQSDYGDAGIRVWFGALSGGTAYRYYIVHWWYQDDGEVHAIGLARAYSQAAPVYDSTTGALMQADATVDLQHLGGVGSARGAWVPAGDQAWSWALNAKGWPVAAWSSVLLEVQRHGPNVPLLWVRDLPAMIAGSTTDWLTAVERGEVLWCFAAVAAARVEGCSSAYRSASVTLDQCR